MTSDQMTAGNRSEKSGSGIAVPGSARRAIRGGIFGNFVDQFDIFLPVIALAPAAAHLFGADNLTRNAALIFVATLIARPIGAGVFGPIADRIGRSRTAQVTIAGIALTTLLIGVVPPQLSDTGALVWILAMRFLGGIFLGGGYTSAVPLAMEWSDPRRRGLVSGLIMWMSPWANAAIAALTFTLLAGLGDEGYASWGWRVPFVIGAAMAVVLLVYYRRHVSDVPGRSATAVGAERSNPLREILAGAHSRRLAQVFVLMSGLWLFTNMAIPVLTRLLDTAAGLSAQQISFTMLCATAVSALAMAAAGHLSTATGRRRFYLVFGVVSAVAAPGALLLSLAPQPLTLTVLWVVLLQVVTVSAYGPIAAYLTELFPTGVRASGYGIAYSLSIVIPALYPYYLPQLQRVLGEQCAVAALLALAGILIATGAALGPDTDPDAALTDAGS